MPTRQKTATAPPSHGLRHNTTPTALTDVPRPATLRYDSGYTSYLQLLIKQRDLLQMQSSVIVA